MKRLLASLFITFCVCYPSSGVAEVEGRFVYVGACGDGGWVEPTFVGLPACVNGPVNATVVASRGMKVRAAPRGPEVARLLRGERVRLVRLVRTSDWRGERPDTYWGAVVPIR